MLLLLPIGIYIFILQMERLGKELYCEDFFKFFSVFAKSVGIMTTNPIISALTDLE